MKLLRRDLGKSLFLLSGAMSVFDAAMLNVAEGTDRHCEEWWKTAVIYEIYPRSFQDSDGDGIGDFPGMTMRLPYLRDLGIDAIWVAACFDSPNDDYGYDVRNYRKIMPELGTLRDFYHFVSEADRLGIRVILDMVFNHTSDEHVWFRESRKSKNNPYRDYYIWRDAINGKPPTNWPSTYGGSGWEYDTRTKQYYFHHYSKKQPDLNWENAEVRNQLYDILKFWRNRGVSGFRFDAIGEISKPLPFRDMSPDELSNTMPLRTSGKRLNEYLHEMRLKALENGHVYAVGEGWGITRKKIDFITNKKNHELDSAFRFEFQTDDISGFCKKKWNLSHLKKFNFSNSFSDNDDVWPVVFLEDHDFPRSVSRFGSSDIKYRERSAKLLATMLFSLRGTPYIYMGQEIGMINYPFQSISDYRDISIINAWKDNFVSKQMSEKEFLKNASDISRDNSRTPMQWDNSYNGGFSKSEKTWMPVNPNYSEINVKNQEGNLQSVIEHYKRMITLRKKNKTFIYGNYIDLSQEDSDVYVYERAYMNKLFLIVLNFSDRENHYLIPKKYEVKNILISNIANPSPIKNNKITLSPWEAQIIQC